MKIRILLCKKSFIMMSLLALIKGSIYGQELIVNGNFETATQVAGASNQVVNFEPWTFDVPDDSRNGSQNLKTHKVEGEVFDGNISAKIISNGGKGKMNQIVSIADSAQTYLFSVYLKPNTVSYEGVDFHLKARAYKGTEAQGMNKKVVYQSSSMTDGYVRYGFPLVFNEDYDAIDVQLVCNQARDAADEKIKGEFLLDNASLMPVTNFVNLDFEEGINYVWRQTLKKSATITNEINEVYNGSYAARLNLVASEDSAILKNQIRIPIEYGKSYSISAMAKVLVDHGNLDSLKIVSRAFDSNHDATVSNATRFDLNTTFAKYDHLYTAAIDDKYLSFEIEAWNQAGSYIIDDVTVVESIANSTNDIEAKLFKIYPNPANDFINIETLNNETVGVKIYDITGKYTYEKAGVHSGERIDIQFLRKGMYVVEVTNNQSTSISKFIKK